MSDGKTRINIGHADPAGRDELIATWKAGRSDADHFEFETCFQTGDTIAVKKP